MRSKPAVPSPATGANRAFIAVVVIGWGFGADVLAADLPILKSGLWELSRATTEQPQARHLTTMCLDESVQAEMRDFGLGVAKEMCSKSDRRIEGNRVIIDATCKLGPTTMTTHSVMTFTGNTAYHTDSSVTYDPPLMNLTQGGTSIDGRWVSACKPGQQPGDITLESGQTLNLKSMMKK